MNRRFLQVSLVLAGLLLPLALIGWGRGRSTESPATPAEAVASEPVPVRPSMPISRIRRDENFFSILTDGGIQRKIQPKIAEALALAYSRPLYEDQPYLLTVSPDSQLMEFLLWSKNGEWEYSVTPAGDGYRAEGRPSSFPKHALALSGTVESSLYAALLSQGESAELICQFVDLFSWDINWFADPRPGDRFSLVFEKIYHESDFVGYGKILAAAYVNGDSVHAAYYFAPDSGTAGYYNGRGESMRKTFLKAPLAFSRVSSRFSLHRLHPILHSYRAHRGVDYAAPAGTPVKAAADGRVARVGYQGGLGNCVALSHGNGYTTDYGHLRAFAREVRAGKTVRQGDIVGYVGSTGLSTGPHLHYQISRHGRTLDPLKADFPSVGKIPDARMPEFESVKAQFRRRLNLEEALYAGR